MVKAVVGIARKRRIRPSRACVASGRHMSVARDAAPRRTFDNNIHRSNRTTAGNPFGTGTSFANTDISFNNEAIWWDKTYNFTPTINAFYNSGDGEYPTNYASGTTPFYGSLYSNADAIEDNQLMWANTEDLLLVGIPRQQQIILTLITIYFINKREITQARILQEMPSL